MKPDSRASSPRSAELPAAGESAAMQGIAVGKREMLFERYPGFLFLYPRQRSWWAYLLAVIAVASMTAFIHLVHSEGIFANICMLYILVVVVTALLFGSLPAIACSIFSFLAFDFFFVEPKYTFTVREPVEWLALCTFLLVATVTGQLTALLQAQTQEARRQELEAATLAETDRLKTALLSMVSHDFRSPLTSIKASVGSLLDEEQPWEPEARRSLLQAIDHETDRINRMVGNILDLSRLQAGAWRPNYEPTSPAELVSAALDSFENPDNQRIQVRFNSAATDVWVDSVQIVQVLRNLLENALKYSPEGSPVELEVREETGTFILEVLDRGAGLPQGEESQIFEAFYRASSLQESAIPGTGVGLAICRGLVEAHKGSLTAYNRSGGGAAFRVMLPPHHGSASGP